MNACGPGRFILLAFMIPLLFLAGCDRAPSFDILGSFFPAWLLCLVPAILLTVVSRSLLQRFVEIAWPVLVYLSLTAFFSFALWFVLFR
jgi:YtcA family